MNNETSQSKQQHVIVGISGGVDSSVAALLLLEQGYAVEGLFMKNWEQDDEDDYCAAAEDTGCTDRKSTRLNSSHRCISYAVFCLKKKKDYRSDNAGAPVTKYQGACLQISSIITKEMQGSTSF